MSHMLYNFISNRVLNRSALHLCWLHMDNTFLNFLQTFYNVKILLKSRQMLFVAFHVINVCNHQNTFIKMLSCLWEHTEFTGRKWRILFTEMLGWEEGPPLYSNTEIAGEKTMDIWFAAIMVHCLLAQFSFLFVTLDPWQHKSENACVGSSASLLSTHAMLGILLILICPALHFFCTFLDFFQATYKTLLVGCRHRHSALQMWGKSLSSGLFSES